MKHRLGLTPGTPTFIAMRVADEEDKLPAKEHATYRSGLGTLLYLTKHSKPSLCHAVRELSKTMHRPAPIHLKQVYSIIRYVLGTKIYGLKSYPKRCSWIIQAFSGSDFAETGKQEEVFMDILYSLWSEIVATLFYWLIGKCDPCRICGFCKND